MRNLQSLNSHIDFTLEFNGPVEIIDTKEVNKIYPEDNEDVFIAFRRLTLQEMAEAAGNDIDDMVMAKKIVSGWAGYAINGKPVAYQPKYLEMLPFQDIDWIIKEAYGATTIQGMELPDVTFTLRQMTSSQRHALQQQSSKGFRDKKAGLRMQKLLLQRIVLGWEGVYYKGKPAPYKPALVELLPWSVVSRIIEVRADDVDHKTEAVAVKN